MLRRALMRVAATSSTSTSFSPSTLPAAGPSSLRPFSSSLPPIEAAAKAAGSTASKAAGTESPPPPPPPPPPRRARWLLFLPPAAAAFLCHWQLERRDWKVRLLAERDEALRKEPVSLEELLSRLRGDRREGGGENEAAAPAPPREMTRVVVVAAGDENRRGFAFDPSSTLLVGPRPRSFGGSTVGGSLVVTPLRRRKRRSKGKEEEEEVGALVVRGWVPSGWKEEEETNESKSSKRRKQEQLLCVLRDSESPSRFVPENDPSRALWHWVDRGEMAAAVGLPRETTPLLEVVSSSGSSPSSYVEAEEEEEAEEERETEAKRSKRPSLMEVLGGRTAERGSGSPLVSSPSSSSSSPSPSPSPSSLPPPPRPKQKQPQPRSLEEISQVSVSPGQHLQYAATWGTLAAATAGLAVKVGRKGGKRTIIESPTASLATTDPTATSSLSCFGTAEEGTCSKPNLL